MKKTIFILLTLFLLIITTTAMTEVKFNGVSFLSTDDVVLNELIERGYAKSNGTSIITNEDSIYLVSNELLGYQPTSIQDYNDVCFLQTISGQGRIAGYPVKGLSLTFAYDGNYKLISIKVDLLGADYATLLEKITKVYGEADVKTVEDEGITSNIWKDGETAVVLYTESEGLDYTLMYGRLDAEELLANCLISDPDDVSGL